MHGQKRSEYKSRLLNPETAAKLSKKAEQWNHLSHQLLSQRRRLFGLDTSAGDGGGDGGTTAATANPSPEMLLSLTEKMLSVNPDPSHLWNIRREMLLHAPSTASSATVEDGDNSNAPGSSSPLFDIQSELTLTAHCLQRNPKSYSSWYHRKWALVHYLTHPKPSVAPTAACATDNDDSALAPEETSPHLQNAKSILQSELGLCKQFLELDERNFHCWNYRRFVVALSGSCKKGVVSAVKSDMEVFDGSWSSWLNQAKVMMGAQLSQSASSAVGGLPGKAYGGKGVDIAKSIVHLSKQELDEIIRNEWDFTTSKIEKNFSNGSAFHYRSKLLPLMLENQLSPSGQSGTPCPNERYDAILTLAWEEWREILKDAIFTEPDEYVVLLHIRLRGTFYLLTILLVCVQSNTLVVPPVHCIVGQTFGR